MQWACEDVSVVGKYYEDERYILAEHFYKIGSFQRAEPLFRELLSENPRDANLLKYLALTLGKLSRYYEAIAVMTEARENGYSEFDALYFFGAIYFNSSFFDKSAIYFKAALDLNPNNILAQIYYAACLKITDSDYIGFETFKSALEREPNDPHVIFVALRYFGKHFRKSETDRMLKKLLENGFEEHFANIIIYHSEKKHRYSEAIKLLKILIEKYPTKRYLYDILKKFEAHRGKNIINAVFVCVFALIAIFFVAIYALYNLHN